MARIEGRRRFSARSLVRAAWRTAPALLGAGAACAPLSAEHAPADPSAYPAYPAYPASTNAADSLAIDASAAGSASPLLPCDAAAIAVQHAALVGPPIAHPMTLHARLHRAIGETPEMYSWDGTRNVLRGDGAGLTMSNGVDDQGPWSLDETGVLVRLKADEVYGRDALFWLLRRDYLSIMRAGKAIARCDTSSNRPAGEARVLFDPHLPELIFDRRDGRLIAMATKDPSGRELHVTPEAWSEPDEKGSRYMSKWTEWLAQEESLEEVERTDAVGPCGLATGATGAAGATGATAVTMGCIGAPTSTFVLDFPSADKSSFVPARFPNHEILVRAKVGADAAWAFVDTGAGLSVLDTTTARGAAFVPAIQIDAAGVNESFVAGVGILPRVSFGSFVAHSLPVAAVPIPVLATFGSLRPEIILGFSFFASATLRVDYAEKRVALTKLGDAPHAADALAIPFRILNGRFVGTVDIEGHPADVMLDTGSEGSLNLDASWVAQTGALAGRPNVQFTGNESAGTHETEHTIVRAKRVMLGPLAVDGALVDVARAAFASDVVGVLGNGIFSMCRAAVFDTAARTLWLEPPCAHEPKRSRFAWELLPADELAHAEKRPPHTRWIVAKLIPGGSADRAGIRLGDEVVQADAVHLGEDPSVFDAVDTKPPGTHVKVVVRRDGALVPIDLTLVELLPP